MTNYAERIEITANCKKNENAKGARFHCGLRKSHQHMLMRPHHKTCGKQTDEIKCVCVFAQSAPAMASRGTQHYVEASQFDLCREGTVIHVFRISLPLVRSAVDKQ